MSKRDWFIHLTSDPLDESACRKWVTDDSTGGIVVFVGAVRNATSGKSVVALEFEAYEPMAIQEMERIAQRAFQNWPVHKVAIHHRTGRLQIGEVPVVIAVSAAHRKAAFEACAFCIDTLKETVPIWKKEIFEDGEVWVAAHP